MALANALIAWPVRFDAASYVLRVTVDGNTQNLTFAVTAGRNYWTTGDAQADASTLGGVGDLLLALKTCLETHPGTWTVNVVLDADFKIQISIASGASAFTILWTHGSTTLDGAVFGYTADTNLDTACTGEDLPHGLWRPGYPVSVDGEPQTPMVGGVARALSGKVRGSHFGTMTRERSIYFERLTQSKVLADTLPQTGPTASFEYAWLNLIGQQAPFRLYLDEGDLDSGSSAYTLWAAISKARPFARKGERPPESLYWDVRLSCGEVV